MGHWGECIRLKDFQWGHTVTARQYPGNHWVAVFGLRNAVSGRSIRAFAKPACKAYNFPLFIERLFRRTWGISGMPVLSDSQRLALLQLLHEKPQVSQRELARAMGVSLGKANYCLQALMEKGLVKFGNFRRNPNKREYAYLITSAGLEEKTRITLAFLKRKIAEYEALEKEIEQLRGELTHSDSVLLRSTETQSKRL